MQSLISFEWGEGGERAKYSVWRLEHESWVKLVVFALGIEKPPKLSEDIKYVLGGKAYEIVQNLDLVKSVMCTLVSRLHKTSYKHTKRVHSPLKPGHTWQT